MNRTLLACLAVLLALPVVACSTSATEPEQSQQSDGIKEFRQTMSTEQAQALVDELKSYPEESACYPRKCSLTDNGDGTAQVAVFATVCCNCGFQDCAPGYEWSPADGMCMPY